MIYFKKINGLRFRSKSQNDLCLSFICSMKKAALRISASPGTLLLPALLRKAQAGLAVGQWDLQGQRTEKACGCSHRHKHAGQGWAWVVKTDCNSGLAIHMRRKGVCDYYGEKVF